MSALRECGGCSFGLHDRHVEHEGLPSLLGGTSCPCKGDCAERSALRPNPFDAIVAALGEHSKGEHQ